jgi:protein-disulfide isomerase
MTTENKYGNMKIDLLFGIYIAFFKHDALRLETLKVGGRDNMKLAIQLYKSDTYVQQQKDTLEQILASMGKTDTTTDTAPTDTTAAVVGDAAKFAAIAQDGYVLGKKDAKITIIEYSDLLCPFCKRHYNAQTIENLVKKYPNDVNMIFRQMPLPQLHPTAPI